MVPFSRFLLFSSKHFKYSTSLSLCQQTLPFPLLQRFGSSWRIPSLGYSKSTKRSYGNRGGHPVVEVEPPPPPRSGRSYVIPATLLGFAGLAALVHFNDERRTIKKGQENKPVCSTPTGPIIGGPFTLINIENQVITQNDFLGNWVLLYFGYTFSPDVGPEQLQVMSKATQILDKENVKVLPVFVTIDPQRDTPSHLRVYLKEFDPRIMGLTGPVNAVRHMAQEYRVFYRKIQEEGDDYLIDTSHNMYLINPKMEVVRCSGIEYNANELAAAITKELKRTSP